MEGVSAVVRDAARGAVILTSVAAGATKARKPVSSWRARFLSSITSVMCFRFQLENKRS